MVLLCVCCVEHNRVKSYLVPVVETLRGWNIAENISSPPPSSSGIITAVLKTKDYDQHCCACMYTHKKNTQHD